MVHILQGHKSKVREGGEILKARRQELLFVAYCPIAESVSALWVNPICMHRYLSNASNSNDRQSVTRRKTTAAAALALVFATRRKTTAARQL